jgi:hypothetical protein
MSLLEYDEAMCGFNSKPGCKPLNGCGAPFAYIYFMYKTCPL